MLPHLFTSDPQVQAAIAAGLLVVGLSQPLSGYVFVIDGVLIGADDGRWLAVASVIVYVLYLPVILLVHRAGSRLLEVRTCGWAATRGAFALWVAMTGFMAIRAVTLWLRVRTTHWMVTGTR